MKYELKNERYEAVFESHGAELTSFKNLSSGQEYLWCGDKKFWGFR